MRVATLVAAVAVLGACSPHRYESVGFFRFQTLVNESAVYDLILKIVPKAGYSLDEDMRKKPPEGGASFAGLNFSKDNRKYYLTFSPTEGTACYFISIDAYDKERAKKAEGELPMLQKELMRSMGKELRYLGSGDCPIVYPRDY